MKDYSELTSTLSMRLSKLNDLLNDGKYQAASKHLFEVQEDLKDLSLWIYENQHGFGGEK